MSDAQRQVVAAIILEPKGRLKGPFIPLLRSPKLMDRRQATGDDLRFQSALPARLRDDTILRIARQVITPCSPWS